jgi:hypothetical protein
MPFNKKILEELKNIRMTLNFGVVVNYFIEMTFPTSAG